VQGIPSQSKRVGAEPNASGNFRGHKMKILCATTCSAHLALYNEKGFEAISRHSRKRYVIF
jgi:hypothetical protein